MQTDFTEVHENLWIGAYPQITDLGELGREFKLIVLCMRVPGGSFPGAMIIPILDKGGPIPEAAFEGAQEIARALYRKEKVLVLCVKGQNRSALIASMALSYYLGRSGRDCADIVCKKRPGSLTNPVFAMFLDNFNRLC